MISHVALWILVTVQGLVLLGIVQSLYRREGVAESRTDEHAAHYGRQALTFTARDTSGADVSSRDFSDRMTAFVFVSPDCPNCSVTLAELEALECKADGNVVVVCQANADRCRRIVDMYGLGHRVVVDDDQRLSKSFGVLRVPAAVLVDERNRITKHGRRLDEEDLDKLLLNNAKDVELKEVTA